MGVIPKGRSRRQYRERSHQPLLNGARARDDFGELGLRLAEAQSMGVGFIVPPVPIAPSCSTIPEESEVEVVLQLL